MKQSKTQPDQQGQQRPQPHEQQKQHQKAGHEKEAKKPVKQNATYQEHEHPESRMTD